MATIAADQLLDVPKLKDIPKSIRELADENNRVKNLLECCLIYEKKSIKLFAPRSIAYKIEHQYSVQFKKQSSTDMITHES